MCDTYTQEHMCVVAAAVSATHSVEIRRASAFFDFGGEEEAETKEEGENTG